MRLWDDMRLVGKQHGQVILASAPERHSDEPKSDGVPCYKRQERARVSTAQRFAARAALSATVFLGGWGIGFLPASARPALGISKQRGSRTAGRRIASKL